MIGIDVARIKRWYVKTYPQYHGVGYKVVVTSLVQNAIDSLHNLNGIDANFTVTCYNLSDNSVAHEVSGIYNRKHYGGWDAYVPSEDEEGE